MRVLALLAALVVVAALPATGAPMAGLHDLVGTWKCTYRAGAARLTYDATWTYDLDGHTLRQVDSWAGGGAEELLASDAHGGWKAVVFDDHGDTTVMLGTGRDPKHIAYHSVYPDASIAETFDQSSTMKYALHATVRSGATTTVSVDTCLRSAR